MSQNTQYLTKPRRSSRSRSNSASNSGSSSSKPHDSSPANEIYTPVFQPPNAYAYKIALPTRPKPGMTPWPGHLPPVVGPALGEATNRPRPASISAAAQHSRSSSSNSNSSSDSEPPVLRNRVVSMTRPSPAAPLVSAPPAPAPPPVQQWTYGLNPLLAPGGGLLWTLRLPVSYIKIRASSLSTPGPLTYNHRAQPVLANRATLSLVVSLPGAAIRVQGDSLGALLDALSDALTAAATPVQWAACDQRSAAAAYQARCGADQAELARGVRRVDLLGPNASFAGLVPAMHAHGAYEWLMQVVVAA